MVINPLSENEESGGNAATPRTTLIERFNEMFPYYLLIGMSEEQYWDKDSTLVIQYRKADELRQERRNQELWLQGRYIYDALCMASPILHAFSKKGAKPKPYLSEPYPISTKQVEIKAEEKNKKVYDKGKRLMERFLVDTNKKFDKDVGGVE